MWQIKFYKSCRLFLILILCLYSQEVFIYIFCILIYNLKTPYFLLILSQVIFKIDSTSLLLGKMLIQKKQYHDLF